MFILVLCDTPRYVDALEPWPRKLLITDET